MVATTQFWLIRHAPVDGPRGVIHAPDAPADLSNSAMFVGLKRILPASASAYCSPARRTRETAAALALDASVEPALREQDFGDWTGRRHADLEAEQGDAYRRFWDAAADNRPPRGESFADQIVRVARRLAQLPGGDAILVVHSGTVRAALAIALDIPADNALRFVIDPLSLTRIERLAEGWRVVTVNQYLTAPTAPTSVPDHDNT
jgi:alpha-ribazole phosphatase